MSDAPTTPGRPLRQRQLCGSRQELDQLSLTELVGTIDAGDRRGWQALVDRLSRPVWGVLSGFNVDGHLRSDAAAETWKSLFEHLGTVRDPESLPGWVGVVAANHMRRILRRHKHIQPCEDIEVVVPEAGAVDPEPDRLVEAEIRQALLDAVGRLSERERLIVQARAFTDDPTPLARIAADQGIPAGSIGPTLGRSLAKLRVDPGLVAFFPVALG